MRFGSEKFAMLRRTSDKKRHNERNRIAKSGNYEIASRKIKLQVLGNIESGQHQTSGERDNF